MKVLVDFRIYGMPVERLEVIASGLSFVMSTFPLLSVKKRKKKKKIQRKRRKKR